MLDKALAVFVTVLALVFLVAVMASVPGTIYGFLVLALSGLATLVAVVKVWSRIL